MRKILNITFVLISSGLLNGQGPIFDEFIFSLWPEYDHPGVLVILSGKVNDEQLPAKIEFMIPVETEKVSAVGVLDTTGALTEVPIDDRGQEKWVSLNLDHSKFHIEFYYNTFATDHLRNVNYQLRFNVDIPEYIFAVQQPIMAEKFLPPELEMESFQDQHGMTFYRKLMPSLPAGNIYQASFSYENHTGETSLDQLRKMMAETDQGTGITEPTSPTATAMKRHRMPLWEPLAVLALIAVIIGFIYSRQLKTAAPLPKTANGSSFCTHCGEKTSPNDKFCANCGNKLNETDSA